MGRKKKIASIDEPSLFDILMTGEIVTEFNPAIPLASLIPPTRAQLIEPTQSFIEDIHKRGLIDALTLREVGLNQYQIVCGCRRWYALVSKEQSEEMAQALVDRKEPPSILTGTIKAELLINATEEQAAAVALRSNAQREDNVLSDIANIQHLFKKGLSPKEITRCTGKKPQTINKLLTLIRNETDPRILLALQDRRCVEETAFAAAKLPAAQQQHLLDTWEASGEYRLTMQMVQDAQRVRKEAAVAQMDRSLFSTKNDPPRSAVPAQQTPDAGKMWEILKGLYYTGALSGTVSPLISENRDHALRFIEQHLDKGDQQAKVA